MQDGQLPPQQAVGHSGLCPNTDTRWSVSNGKIYVCQVQSGVPGRQVPFIFKGVRYQPTPINIDGGAAGTPMGDFFYIGARPSDEGAEKTMIFYEPIWQRDVGPNGLIRKLGANNIGVYDTYNVPPFTMSHPDASGHVVPSADPSTRIAWDALGPIRYVSAGGQEYPTYMPAGASSKKAPPYWYHYCHDRFLDICWNNGTDPIYVWLAVGVSADVCFSSNPAPAPGYRYTQVREYFLKSARWLAQSYGHHPAVAGFYVTNETNQPGPNGTYPYLEYWNFLNDVHDALKSAAPNKLTIAAMQDDVNTITTQLRQYTTTPVIGQPAPQTELLYVDRGGRITTSNTGRPAHATDAYKLDLWGWNLYAAANDATPIIQELKKLRAAGYSTPFVLSEIGVPQAMRFPEVNGARLGPIGGNDPYFTNPNGWLAKWNGTELKVELVNPSIRLGQESLPVVATTSTERTSVTFFPTHPTWAAGGLIAYETDTTDYWLYIGNPVHGGSQWTKLDKGGYGSLLETMRSNGYPAAGPALILSAYLQAAYAYQVGNDAVPQANQLLSGVQVFEYSDEWFKWVDPSIANTQLETKAAGVHDFRDCPIAPWGPANAQFFTTWEEEWFGLVSVLPNQRSSTAPAIGPDGWLNGGPDSVTPRASYYVVKNFFKSQTSSAPPASKQDARETQR